MSAQGGFQGLRVALVGPFPPRSGDLSRYDELLAKLLQQEGVHVRRVNTDVPTVRRLPGIGIHLLPLVQIPVLLWRLLVAVPRVDVAHVQATSFWGFYLPVVLTLLVGGLFRRRRVICYSGGLARPFMARRWRLVRSLVKRADGLAVTSDFLKEIFQREGLAPVVLPNVFTPETLPFLPRRAWPPLLMWASVLEPEANPGMALAALARVRQTLPEARLLLAGRGTLAGEVAAQARALEIEQAIAYRPELSGERWLQALHEASVFWHTASLDNLPQRLLEAAACGTVVVGTSTGAVPELLHDGVDALLVQPEDAVALAETTLRVLARPYLAESLANNARLSAERYAWSDMRPGWAKLYGIELATAKVDEDAAPDDLLARAEFLMSDPLVRPPAEPELVDPPSRRRARR